MSAVGSWWAQQWAVYGAGDVYPQAREAIDDAEARGMPAGQVGLYRRLVAEAELADDEETALDAWRAADLWWPGEGARPGSQAGTPEEGLLSGGREFLQDEVAGGLDRVGTWTVRSAWEVTPTWAKALLGGAALVYVLGALVAARRALR